jgi:hypothetical protein
MRPYMKPRVLASCDYTVKVEEKDGFIIYSQTTLMPPAVAMRRILKKLEEMRIRANA